MAGPHVFIFSFENIAAGIVQNPAAFLLTEPPHEKSDADQHNG